MRRVVLIVTLLVLGLAVVPAGQAAQTPSPAERERQLRKELDAATAEWTSARDGLEHLDSELAQVESRRDANARQVESAREMIRAQAVAMYRSGGVGWFSPLLEGSDDVVERMEFADRIVTTQQVQLADARAVVDRYETAVADAERLLAEQQELTRKRQAAVRTLQSRFREAKELADEAERAAAERRAAAAGSSGSSSSGGSGGGSPQISGSVACPIGTPRSYTDTWGASRSGGRSHQGTDILSPHGTTIFAYTSGTVSRAGPSGNLGGTVIYLQGSDGNEYYYAHLSSVSVSAGSRVTLGQAIGRNGATGNAPPDTPHLHFEVHPGGGAAVNPFPWVQRACG